LRRFRDEFGENEKKIAERTNLDAYDLLTLEASRIPPGSEGLLFLPHLMGAGPPEFDPYAKGVLFGLTLNHTKAHFIRAILESIAFMLRRNIEMIEELAIKFHKIRYIDGGSRSSLWNQIKADVTSKAILTFQNEEVAYLGVAILAGVAGGLFKSIEEGCEVMVRLKKRYEPNPEN